VYINIKHITYSVVKMGHQCLSVPDTVAAGYEGWIPLFTVCITISHNIPVSVQEFVSRISCNAIV